MRFTSYGYRSLNKNRSARLLTMNGLNPAPGNNDHAASQIWENWFWGTDSGGPVVHSDQMTFGSIVTSSQMVQSTISVSHIINPGEISGESTQIFESKRSVSGIPAMQANTESADLTSVAGHFSSAQNLDNQTAGSSMGETKITRSAFDNVAKSVEASQIYSIALASAYFQSSNSEIQGLSTQSRITFKTGNITGQSEINQQFIESVCNRETIVNNSNIQITQNQIGYSYLLYSSLSGAQTQKLPSVIIASVEHKNQIISQLSNSVNNNIDSQYTAKHNFVYSSTDFAGISFQEYSGGQNWTMRKKIVFII